VSLSVYIEVTFDRNREPAGVSRKSLSRAVSLAVSSFSLRDTHQQCPAHPIASVGQQHAHRHAPWLFYIRHSTVMSPNLLAAHHHPPPPAAQARAAHE